MLLNLACPRNSEQRDLELGTSSGHMTITYKNTLATSAVCGYITDTSTGIKLHYLLFLGQGAEPFLALELGEANAPPFLSFAPPPSHSVFDPIKLSLFETVVNVMKKVGYHPWNLCERIKFWKRILRNRVLIIQITSILGSSIKVRKLKVVYCLCFKKHEFRGNRSKGFEQYIE